MESITQKPTGSGDGALVVESVKSKGPNLRWLFWLPALLAALIVSVMLAALVLLSAHSLQRLKPVQDHLTYIDRLHAIGLSMQGLLERELQQGEAITQADLQSIRLQLQSAEKSAPGSHPKILSRLHSLEQFLSAPAASPRDVLLQSSNRLQSIQDQERMLHNELVGIVARDSALEHNLALILLFSLPLITVVTFYLLMNRFKQPLDDLNNLLRRLASRDYRPVSEDQVEQSASLIQPVYHSYNALVNRLAALEEEHRALQLSLEKDVQRATSALLEQATELARAEKLAAVGELSAAMAHEMRNPLAGIQLACTKLGRQLPADQQKKIDLVVSELKRVNNLLSERLYEARHAPEKLVQVSVVEMVDNLVALLSYQMPQSVRLLTEVEPALCCRVPEAGLRQSLLNLVMNAARAIGDSPGQITLFARQRDAYLEIGVYDTGPGFPQQIIEQGVRPFVTGHVDGIGLGLSIVKRFVRDFAGELSLANRAEGGACVTLILPFQNEPGSDTAPGHAA